MASPTPPAAPPARPTTPSVTITRVLLSAFGLALVLAIASKIPLLATLLVMGMIVYAGWKASWTANQLGIRIVLGVTIFVTLRFLAAKVLGLYPADTFNTLDNSGGIYWILVGHDVSTRILWEVAFAFVAGQITLDWVTGKSKLAKAFIVFGFVVMTWYFLSQANSTVENEGIVGAGWKGVRVVLFGKPSPTAPQATYVPQPPPPPQPIATCTTPCKMQIGWNTQIASDGKLVLIKFSGKTKQFHFFGREDQAISLESFNPGLAEFTSPDSNQILVQLFKK